MNKMTKSNKKIFILFFFVTTFLNASPIVDIETVRQSGEIGKFRNLEFSEKIRIFDQFRIFEKF